MKILIVNFPLLFVPNSTDGEVPTSSLNQFFPSLPESTLLLAQKREKGGPHGSGAAAIGCGAIAAGAGMAMIGAGIATGGGGGNLEKGKLIGPAIGTNVV